ncbi:2-oxo acid dehydrogenase subunit E2 [Kribbella pittospori]|uniref:Dihydrolipoamide acetyltransferase component of pyruvate dehydrogenase complex n=1 Tax=Kribbella pittospori TaxID=722689 RepID=A0A4R0KTV3_9ACTN|nr:dihydrolipoamide acetyltransferase family protein [Kribbella pittospori]TCC59455.1 2-oxo acid dehydrogenase subunit E2 [Kribbella pittospori]
MNTFLLPDLGEGLTEAEIVRWLVKVGDVVTVDAPVAEVETAKSIVELPSPYAGVVEELHGDPGTTIPVGKPLITIGAVDADPRPAPAGGSRQDEPAGSGARSEVSGGNSRQDEPAGSGARSAGAAGNSRQDGGARSEVAGEAYRQEERAGSGSVLVGYGTGAGTGSGRRRKPRPHLQPARSAAMPANSSGTPASGSAPDVGSARRVPLVVSPLVRRIARDAEVDLKTLTGSGPDGLIVRRDVEQAIAQRFEKAPQVEEVSSRTGLPELRRIPMSGFRKVVAATLTRSRAEIPEATTWVDVDATALVELRESLRSAKDSGPGLLALMARFTVAGLQRYPELNGFVDTEREELVQYDGINLGLAAQTDRGLVVPAVANAHTMTTRALDGEIRRLTESARTGRLTPYELGCGTFTLNNYGSFGVDGSAAIINHPQVAILGVGRIIDRPWVVNGQIAIRKLTQLSLVFDHRVCDGGTAAAFLRFVADAFENPASAFADL